MKHLVLSKEGKEMSVVEQKIYHAETELDRIEMLIDSELNLTAKKQLVRERQRLERELDLLERQLAN